MRKLMAALLLTTLVSSSAHALNTKEVVAIAAMPLAVAAVSDVSGVPASDLVNVVSAMNRAYVPAPQFVEIVRYTPVALVDDTMNPPFVAYANTQLDNGLYGDAYAVSLADRLRLYDVNQINVVQPVTVTPTYVVQRDYIPSYVVTRVQQQPLVTDPIALIAMPLAVAAVSQLANIPQSDLFGLISSLNRAYVPAPQFVEIVRYSPMVLVDRDPGFVTFVNQEIDRGFTGTRLVRVIDRRFDDFGFRDVNFIEPAPARVIVERQEFVPQVVVNRIAEARAHPHGGPPGQLKKSLGYQTGAEVVHGGSSAVVQPRVARKAPKAPKAPKVQPRTQRELVVLPNAKARTQKVTKPKQSHGSAKVKPQKSHGKKNRGNVAVRQYSAPAAPSVRGHSSMTSSSVAHGPAKKGGKARASGKSSKGSKSKGKRNH